MYTEQPKNLMILYILDILKNRSDADHRLSQQDILLILKNDYAMSADRKAVKRNLMNLIDFAYPIEYSQITRKNKAAEEVTLMTDWYYEHEFSQPELRLLIDSLLFSKHVPNTHCQDLIGKLEVLSSRYFKSNARHILNVTENQPTNHELFFTIEVLDEAITLNRQVCFQYNDYDVDMKLHPRTNQTGNAREYIINPYRMVTANGRYYLICNYDKYNNVSYYRLDRITGIQVLDKAIKPIRNLLGMQSGLDLPKHMAEHIYMFSGESVWVTFIAERWLVSEIIDWFGKGVNFSDITEKEIKVKVQVNEEAMKRWALQYALHVKVIEPQRLRDSVYSNLQEAIANYSV